MALKMGNWGYFTSIITLLITGRYWSHLNRGPSHDLLRQYDPPQRGWRLVGGIDEETSNDHCVSEMEMVGLEDSDML